MTLFPQFARDLLLQLPRPGSHWIGQNQTFLRTSEFFKIWEYWVISQYWNSNSSREPLNKWSIFAFGKYQPFTFFKLAFEHCVFWHFGSALFYWWDKVGWNQFYFFGLIATKVGWNNCFSFFGQKLEQVVQLFWDNMHYAGTYVFQPNRQKRRKDKKTNKMVGTSFFQLIFFWLEHTFSWPQWTK